MNRKRLSLERLKASSRTQEAQQEELIPHELALFQDEVLFGAASINVGMAYFLLDMLTPTECTVAELRGLHYSADEGGRADPQRPVMAVIHPGVETAVVIENNALIHAGPLSVRVPLYLIPVTCLPLLCVWPEDLQQYEQPYATGAAFHVSLKIRMTRGGHNLYWLQGHADQQALADGLKELLCGVRGLSDQTWARLRAQVLRLKAEDGLVIELSSDTQGAPYATSLVVTHRDRMISREVN